MPLWHHFKPKQFGKCQEREKLKIIVSFRSVPNDALQKIPKKQEKNYKNKKNTIMASF